MSSSLHNDDDRFDRLVDGELSEPERRQLLTALDQEPEGWRRCALAFLEAQTWKQGLGALLRPAQPTTACATTNLRSVPGLSSSAEGTVGQANRGTRAARKRSFWIIGGTVLAMAASFLLAFGLAGHWLGRGKTGVAPSGGGSQFVDVRPVPSPLPPSTPGTPSSPWQMVGLPASGAGNGAMVIPAAEHDRWDDQWIRNLPSAMPQNVKRAFERTGHRVQQQRELIPVRMNDGRILIVPVEEMEIQPAQRPVY